MELTDQILQLEEQLATYKRQEDLLKGTYAELRDQIFSLMDRVNGNGSACRVLSPTGMVVARELRPREPYPVINVEALEQLLPAHLWEEVTDVKRIFNEEKLAHAVEDGIIGETLLYAVTEIKQPQQVLQYKEASKEEKLLLEVQKKSEKISA